MRNNNTALWVGIATGTAVAVGLLLSRRRRSTWDTARATQKRVVDRSGDVADCTRDIVERCRNIYDEARKVVDDASDLWQHGRKLVGV